MEDTPYIAYYRVSTDRQGRSVHFIAGLMESGVAFVVADMPNANDFMLHISAAVAQEKRRLISQRTRDALAEAKERGVEIGKNGRVLAQQNRAAADAYAQTMIPIIEEIKADCDTSIRAIAAALNRQGIPTMKRGRRWYPNSVRRLLQCWIYSPKSKTPNLFT